MKSNLSEGLVSEQLQPHAIPDSWLWVEIGSVTDVLSGGTPSSTQPPYYEGGDIPWLTPADLSSYSSVYISAGRRNITKAGLQNSSARLLPKDTLLFSSRAPIGYVVIAENPISTNQGFKNFLPTEAFLPRYGYWYLKGIKKLAESMASGTTFLELSGSKAAKIPFPLAPLSEQRRIVAQLDAAMQKLEASQERLEKLPDLLKKFRQAVLAAAVSGRLTEAWRAEQPQGETGADLLDRIRAERRAQWEEKQRAKLSGKQLSLSESWKSRYEEPAAPDTTELNELPKEWVWTNIDNLVQVVRGASPRPAGDPRYFGGDIPWITVGEITKDENMYLYSVDKFVTPAGRDKSRYIEPNTLLLSNSGATLGVPKITTIGGCINDGSVALFNMSEQTKKYLYIVLKGMTNKLRQMNQGAAQPNLNTDIVRAILVPFPPLAEQEEIARQVSHYFELADQLEARFEQAAALVEQLPQALLAKAFSGQLVPQDPTDEPASELLARLRTEPAVPAKGKRGRKAKVAAEAPLFE